MNSTVYRRVDDPYPARDSNDHIIEWRVWVYPVGAKNPTVLGIGQGWTEYGAQLTANEARKQLVTNIRWKRRR